MAGPSRVAGNLPVSDALRAVLCELRLVAGVDTLPELDVDRVRDVERGAGMALSDEVLAVFAARVPALETDREMTLAGVVGLTGAVRALGARGDLVAIGRDLGTRVFRCVEKGHEEADGVRLAVYDADERSLSHLDLLAFLRGEVARLRAERPQAAPWDPALAGTFVPRLTRRLPESAPGRRVRHKTFGEGKILREIGQGPNRKVQVDFPGRGLKLLRAEYLEYLE